MACQPRDGRWAARADAQPLLRFDDSNLSLAPRGVPAHAGELRRVQPGEKLPQFPFIFGDADEAAQRMPLTRACAAAHDVDVRDVAARHGDLLRVFAQLPVIDFEWRISFERAERTHAIPRAGEQDREARFGDGIAAGFELGGGNELYAESRHRFLGGLERYAQPLGFDAREIRSSASMAEAFATKLREGGRENVQRFVARVEQVKVEMECFARLDMAAIEMGGTKDEQASWLAHTARA